AGTSITPAGVFNPAGMSGSFTFTYSITQNGCTGRDEKTINVLELPSAVTVLAPGNSSCQGQSIPLSLNIPTGGTYSIQWKRNNVNIIGAISNSYLANQNGTYSAVLSQSTCAVPTSDVILTFHAIPATPTISQIGLDLTSSAPTGNQWRKNGVDIVGATSQTFTVTQSGIYTVVVNNSGCLSDPSIGRPVTVTAVDDEIEEDEQFQISVFPNPNEGRFRIEMEGVKHPTIDVIIIDAVGKEIWNETLTTSDGLKVATDLHFPKLSSGVYWLKVPLKDQVIMRKMIIR
ncbi:MAG TPA: T9SS type A sorting domain-containing protein, partial [Catalimonadaceae bacterium]|nr:T9SS type A sorting domain-containing protein [Catalimonadaceae bacterium]